MCSETNGSQLESPKEATLGAEMKRLSRIVESWHLNYWHMATIFFIGCFIISILCFLMLETTYQDARDLAYKQQTEIIDIQRTIITIQNQMIRQLSGDNATVPAQPDQARSLPVY